MRSHSILWRLGASLTLWLLLFSLSAPGLAADGDTDPSPAKVNINSAGAEELESLPGIGPSLAGMILDYRTKLGPFQRTEDLMNVRGIGEKKFLKLKDLITVGASTRHK